MPGNTFGHLFRFTTAGESHGPGYVVIVDGLPSGLPLSEADLLPDLSRRRPGQSSIVTQREEPDSPEILSGVFEGVTTGTPVAVLVRNRDQRSRDYGDIRDKYRPGHADFTFDAKYGVRDYRGGGRSSARETVCRVIAGAMARKLLARMTGGDYAEGRYVGECLRVQGYVTQVGDVRAEIADPASVTREQVEATPVRCPDAAKAAQMIALIERVRSERDSIGGVAEVVALNVPVGWGEPVFDKLKADLAKALFSLPAVLGVEYGIGFGCATLRGSQNNDTFHVEHPGRRSSIRTDSNRHGGMLGGISSGMPIVLRAAVKPTSSIPSEQATVTRDARPTTIVTRGRHDPCLLPRFVPMAEAMVAVTLADHALRQRAHGGLLKAGGLDFSKG